MKYYINNLKSNFAVNKGFTLIELLVAAVIMSIVVTLAGTAFVAILQQNRKADAETERRTNLNRALDYIANDIRMANEIQVTGSFTDSRGITTPELTLPSGSTGVLRLVIPGKDANNVIVSASNIVYYTTNSPTGWDNPKSIMRAAGDYVTSTTVDAADAKFLVDGIQTPSSNAPNTTTDCPSTVGTLTGSEGFYACVYTGGRKADLYLYGRLPNNQAPYLVKTTVFTRAK